MRCCRAPHAAQHSAAAAPSQHAQPSWLNRFRWSANSVSKLPAHSYLVLLMRIPAPPCSVSSVDRIARKIWQSVPQSALAHSADLA